MDLIALLRLTLRRWIVVVPVLLLTFVGLAYMVLNRSSDYVMKGSYMLVSADTITPAGEQTDPKQAAEALTSELQRPSLLRQLESEGLSSDVAVSVGDTGTTLRVTVSGSSAQMVTDTATRVVELVPDLLKGALGDEAATVTARAITTPSVDDVSADGDTFSLTTPIVVTSVPLNSGNPFGANLATVQSIISLAGSVEFRDQVAAQAPGVQYLLVNTVQLAPILELTVTAATPEESVAGYDFVSDQMQAALTRLQDANSVNPSFRTVFRTIVDPPRPAASPSSVVKPAAGLVILGGGLAVTLAVLAESIAVGRRRARAQANAGRESSGTGENTANAESPGSHGPATMRPGSSAVVASADAGANTQDNATRDGLGSAGRRETSQPRRSTRPRASAVRSVSDPRAVDVTVPRQTFGDGGASQRT